MPLDELRAAANDPLNWRVPSDAPERAEVYLAAATDEGEAAYARASSERARLSRDPANLTAAAGDKQVSDEQFVAFGPEQARKARETAGLPEPPVVPDVQPDAGLIRRFWAYLTQGSGELRKLWNSRAR